MNILPKVFPDRRGFDDDNMLTNGEKDVLSIIKSGDTVFDVGASSGLWCNMLLSKIKDVKLYAFEPLPESFIELEKVNCHKFNIAMGSLCGQNLMYFYKKKPVLSGMYRRNSIIEKRFEIEPEKIIVPTLTIDAFCRYNNIEKIDYLKIDAEGSEFEILLGAMKMLKACAIKNVQFEYGGCFRDAGITLEVLYETLVSMGMKIYRITSDGLIQIDSFTAVLENYRQSNYLGSLCI